jgi:hypothetical protein
MMPRLAHPYLKNLLLLAFRWKVGSVFQMAHQALDGLVAQQHTLCRICVVTSVNENYVNGTGDFLGCCNMYLAEPLEVSKRL